MALDPRNGIQAGDFEDHLLTQQEVREHQQVIMMMEEATKEEFNESLKKIACHRIANNKCRSTYNTCHNYYKDKVEIKQCKPKCPHLN